MTLIPNVISLLRIVFSLSLLLIEPLSPLFLALYLVCGLSDLIDGYIARKTHTTSNLGAKLDSIADITMLAVWFITLYPLIPLNLHISVWVIGICLLKISSILLIWIKYRTFRILHTYGNKFVGVILFLYPLGLSIDQSVISLYLICSIASLVAIEEFFINLTSKELKTNQKSIFLD